MTKIYGPPGTGKTTWLVKMLETEIKAGVPPIRIAYLSYTKSAAEVVGKRVKLSPKERHWFRTIHSACFARLGLERIDTVIGSHYARFAMETGYKLTVREDELVEDYSRHDGTDFGIVLKAHRLARSRCTSFIEAADSLDHNALLHNSVALKFLERWKAFKEENGLMDYEDMLEFYLKSNLSPLPCDVVILDEAQDCSELQWRVFEKLIQHAKRVYIAGDDDQAIYHFMGGSEYGFLEYKADEEIVLTQSYRVPAAIGLRATALIETIKHRKVKPVIWRDGKGELAHWRLEFINLPWRIWREQGKSVYVLTRHRSGAWRASDQLLSIGIPHAVGRYALHRTTQAKLIRDYVAVRKGGQIPANQMATLLDKLGLEDEAVAIRARAKKESELTLGAHDSTAKWDDDSWLDFFAKSKTQMENAQSILQIINQEGIEAIGKEPQITVMTMHGAKGHEADIVVIIPDCLEVVWGNLSSPSEIRLAYVALTRARESCYVLEPQTNTWITHLMGV